MKNLKFTVHPLFIAFGIYFAFCGKVFSFIIFTLSAVIHEIGHSLSAAKRGYRLKKLVLMPYGAIVKGDIRDMTYQDEVVIALSGPFLSLFIAALFVSFWWIIPEAYPYTELCVLANLTIATVNLLPCYPLDGGRVFLAFLSCFIKRKTALKISKIIGLLTSASIFGLFIYSAVIGRVNYSISFFALFMLFGNVFVGKDLEYERIKAYFTLGELSRGKKIKKIALLDTVTVKELQNYYTYGELLECYIYNEKGKRILALFPEDVIKLFTSGSLYEKVVNEYEKIK